MTEEEIRKARFPVCAGGYGRSQVRLRLQEIAGLPEKGFAPPFYMPLGGFRRNRFFRGYDPAAVDLFFDTLAGEAFSADLRVLPVAPQRTGAVDISRPPRRLGAAWKQYERDSAAAWLLVSDLPGTRLRQVREAAKFKIIDGEGEALLTRRGRTMTLANGQTLAQDPSGSQIVDAATGDPVLWIKGAHRYQNAAGLVLLPGRRWLSFPVVGAGLRNAVMTAITESGITVMWIRRIERQVYEVLLSPECELTPEALCVTHLATLWLAAYYTQDGGGG
jgi:hypothetical protein